MAARRKAKKGTPGRPKSRRKQRPEPLPGCNVKGFFTPELVGALKMAAKCPNEDGELPSVRDLAHKFAL